MGAGGCGADLAPVSPSAHHDEKLQRNSKYRFPKSHYNVNGKIYGFLVADLAIVLTCDRVRPPLCTNHASTPASKPIYNVWSSSVLASHCCVCTIQLQYYMYVLWLTNSYGNPNYGVFCIGKNCNNVEIVGVYIIISTCTQCTTTLAIFIECNVTVCLFLRGTCLCCSKIRTLPGSSIVMWWKISWNTPS